MGYIFLLQQVTPFQEIPFQETQVVREEQVAIVVLVVQGV